MACLTILAIPSTPLLNPKPLIVFMFLVISVKYLFDDNPAFLASLPKSLIFTRLSVWLPPSRVNSPTILPISFVAMPVALLTSTIDTKTSWDGYVILPILSANPSTPSATSSKVPPKSIVLL